MGEFPERHRYSSFVLMAANCPTLCGYSVRTQRWASLFRPGQPSRRSMSWTGTEPVECHTLSANECRPVKGLDTAGIPNRRVANSSLPTLLVYKQHLETSNCWTHGPSGNTWRWRLPLTHSASLRIPMPCFVVGIGNVKDKGDSDPARSTCYWRTLHRNRKS